MKKRLLLNLRHVPDDEAQEILELLSSHNIDHYLTPAGPFGISAGGIWVRHDDDCDRAKSLFDAYQKQRALNAMAKAKEAKARGQQETVLSLWRRRPWHVMGMIVLSLIVLMIFFAPMLQIARTVQ